MQVEKFRDSPVGRLVPVSGVDARHGAFSHSAFVPAPLPAQIVLTQPTLLALSSADQSLGALKGTLALLPNPNLLVRPVVTKEAVATSALEGTYALFSEVLEAEYVEERSRSAEVREVRNYIRAATHAFNRIKNIPICLTLLSELQEILVAGTRGDSYDAGRLRERIVCIGDEGAGILESRFVPPPPGDELARGVSDWEKWVNAEDDYSIVVKAALAHYQFETLHPFSDGNGRLGRLIITLQLMETGVISHPVLNMSPWLEPRKSDYTGHMLRVSATGDFDAWVCFFAKGMAARAQAASRTIADLLQVRESFVERLRRASIHGAAITIAENLIGYPVLDVAAAKEICGKSYVTANTAVSRLVEVGILRQASPGNYGRIFICDEVRRIVEEA